MKTVDIKSNIYIDFRKEIYDKNQKIKIGDNVRISKYKNVFKKVTVQIGLEKVLWLKKLKTLFRGHVLLIIVKEKKLFKRFTKTNCKKTNQKELRI